MGTKVQFSADTIEQSNENKTRKSLKRMPTPKVRQSTINRRSLNRVSLHALTEATKNLQKCVKGDVSCYNLTEESEMNDLASFKTPVSRTSQPPHNQSDQMESLVYDSSSDQSGKDELFNDTVIKNNEDLDFDFDDEENSADKSKTQSGKKKLPSALTGTAWHKQMRRRLSITNLRRQSDSKFQSANKVDFTKEKSRRSCASIYNKPLNSSVKSIKSDQTRRLSFKLPRAKPEAKSAVNTSIKKVQDKTSETSKVTNSRRSTALNSSSQDSKRHTTLQKKTAPSIVNTDKGIVIRNEEVLYFGIPLESKKKNTKPVPFSFEARNKELQLKKEQKLKILQESEKKQTKQTVPKTTKISPKTVVKKNDSKSETMNNTSNVPKKNILKVSQSANINDNKIQGISRIIKKPVLNLNTLSTGMKTVKKIGVVRDSVPVQSKLTKDSGSIQSKLTKSIIKDSSSSVPSNTYETENKELHNEIRQLKLKLKEAENQDKSMNSLKTQTESQLTNAKIQKLETDVSVLQTAVIRLENQVETLIKANSLLQDYLKSVHNEDFSE